MLYLVSTLFKSETIKSVIENYSKDIARETLSEIKDISVSVMRKEVHLDDGILIIDIA